MNDALPRPPTLTTPAQVCREVQITRRTLTNWMKDGKVPFIRLSPRMLRFDMEAVRAALLKFTINSI